MYNVSVKKFLIISVLLIATISVALFAYSRDSEPVVAEKIEQAPKTIIKECILTDDDVLSSVNKIRVSNGLRRVYYSPKLDVVAEYRSKQQDGAMDNHDGFRPFINQNHYGDFFSLQSEIQNEQMGCGNADYRVGLFKLSNSHWSAIMNPRFDSMASSLYKGVLVIELGDLN